MIRDLVPIQMTMFHLNDDPIELHRDGRLRDIGTGHRYPDAASWLTGLNRPSEWILFHSISVKLVKLEACGDQTWACRSTEKPSGSTCLEIGLRSKLIPGRRRGLDLDLPRSRVGTASSRTRRDCTYYDQHAKLPRPLRHQNGQPRTAAKKSIFSAEMGPIRPFRSVRTVRLMVGPTKVPQDREIPRNPADRPGSLTAQRAIGMTSSTASNVDAAKAYLA